MPSLNELRFPGNLSCRQPIPTFTLSQIDRVRPLSAQRVKYAFADDIRDIIRRPEGREASAKELEKSAFSNLSPVARDYPEIGECVGLQSP